MFPPDDDSPDDDATLFREAIGPVRELPPGELPPLRPRPKPRARQFERDEVEALRQSRDAPFDLANPDIGDRLEFRRPNVGPAILRRLKRGQYAVEDEIDLHGATAEGALELLRRFLHEAHDEGHRCLRIVHGKGLRSRDGVPVLKVVTDRFLRHNGDVLAFASAPEAGGGSGAVLVLLRR